MAVTTGGIGLLTGKYDLHTHTTASDGMLSPMESVSLAKERGMAGLAITDHDTVGGVAEACRIGKSIGVDVIPGVEISASADEGDIHMLGLWIDPENAVFAERLAANRDTRNTRNVLMMSALRSVGFEVTLEEAEGIASERRSGGDRSVSRPHIAELLVRKGYVETVQEAFDRYLTKGKPGHVKVPRIAPEVAIQWIHEAGGLAVIAHPGLYRSGVAIIEDLAGKGLDGIEAAHADHDEEQEALFRSLAEKHRLLVTAGSDFHGFRDGAAYHAELGARTLNAESVRRLQASLRARKKEMP